MAFRTPILALTALLSAAIMAASPAGSAIAPMDEAMAERALGDEKAPVTMIEYASLGCSHCANFHRETLPKIKKNYIETGKVNGEYKGKPKVSDKATLLFELHGKRWPVGENGNPTIIAIKTNKSTSAKSGYIKLFKAMNYKGEATTFVELLGEDYIGTIAHYEGNDGKTYATLKDDATGVFTVRAPFTENCGIDANLSACISRTRRVMPQLCEWPGLNRGSERGVAVSYREWGRLAYARPHSNRKCACRARTIRPTIARKCWNRCACCCASRPASRS